MLYVLIHKMIIDVPAGQSPYEAKVSVIKNSAEDILNKSEFNLLSSSFDIRKANKEESIRLPRKRHLMVSKSDPFKVMCGRRARTLKNIVTDPAHSNCRDCIRKAKAHALYIRK